MKSLVLALDAGTSGCKAEIFTLEGRSVSRGSSGYGSGMIGSSGTELEPSGLRSAVASAAREALAGSDPGDIGGVGVSAQLGLATIDSKGRPVGNLVTWADPRGVDEARRITELLGESQVYQTCGRRVSPEWMLPRLLHMRATDPKSWAQGATHLSIKDFLVHELTGRRLTDPTHASYTLAYDVTRRQWSTPILDAVDVPAGRLPEVVPSHQIAGEAGGTLTREMGLPDGVPVVVGGPDGTMGALGAGLVDEGRAIGMVGTTDVFFACSRTPTFDPLRGTVVNCYAVPDLWALGGPMSSTGGCLQWFATHFAHREAGEAARKNLSLYAYLDELAQAVPPGSDGLLCIPSLVGERAPSWDPDRRGAFSGLTPRHGVAHFARAILEGSAFASRVMVERLRSCGVTSREVVLAGGGARSRLWCQIRADVLDTPVRVPEIVDATNLGTALLVAVALGHHRDCDAAAREMVTLTHRLEPDPAHTEKYRALFDAYLEVHEALGPPTERLSDTRPDAVPAARIIPESGESKT